MSIRGAAISRTDLARHTRHVLERARRSGPVIVTGHGDEQAVVLDITDYRLLRAAVAYRLQQESAQLRAKAEMPRDLGEEEVQAAIETAGGNVQAGRNRVLAAYWDGNISLGRAAALLAFPASNSWNGCIARDCPCTWGRRRSRTWKPNSRPWKGEVGIRLSWIPFGTSLSGKAFVLVREDNAAFAAGQNIMRRTSDEIIPFESGQIRLSGVL